MTVVMAILILDDEHGEPLPRQTCCGCTAYLEGLGMVRKIAEHVLNERQPEFSFATYVIEKPFDLAACRSAIRSRHIRPPEWGGLV
jgi:hypothetical protein